MTYFTWLKEHGVWTATYLFLLCTIELFLITVVGGGFLMGYVFVALTGAFLCGTYVEFRRTKAYFEELEGAMEILKEKYLFYEMIERQDLQEERAVKDLFYQVETSTITELEGLKRDSEEYREFVETWVHEIKIPIAVIRMILANHKEADNGISSEVERMEKYVEQALFYARSSVVSKDYLVSRVNLQKTMEQTVLAHKRQLRELNARLNLHDLEREVYSDGKWLQFMLGQVLDNSMKYAKGKDADGCGLSLEVFATETPNAIQLHVKDNGIGIKANEVDRVFDKGFTGQNGRSGAKSTGIGLYLCKKLCDKLEHGITLTSKEGEGTEVIFIFPRSSMMEAAEQA